MTVPVMVIPHLDLGPRLLTLAAAVLLMRVKLLLSALLQMRAELVPVLMRLLEALVMRVLSGGMGKGMVRAAVLARALLVSAVLVSTVPARVLLVSDVLASAVLARALLVSAVLVRVLLVSAVLVSDVLVSAVLARALLVSTVPVSAVLVSAVLARVLVVVSTVLLSAVLARTLVVSAVLARALLLSAVLIMTWMMSAVLVSTVLARTLVVRDMLMRVADDLQQALVLQVWASGGPAGEGVAHGARSVVVRAAHSAHFAHPQSFRAVLTEGQLTGLQHHLHNNGCCCFCRGLLHLPLPQLFSPHTRSRHPDKKTRVLVSTQCSSRYRHIHTCSYRHRQTDRQTDIHTQICAPTHVLASMHRQMDTQTRICTGVLTQTHTDRHTEREREGGGGSGRQTGKQTDRDGPCGPKQKVQHCGRSFSCRLSPHAPLRHRCLSWTAAVPRRMRSHESRGQRRHAPAPSDWLRTASVRLTLEGAASSDWLVETALPSTSSFDRSSRSSRRFRY